MDRLLMDLRFALRQMARAPGFTAMAVLVLGLGIGTSTAIFGVVDNILLRPLDLPDSDRVVWLCEEHEQTGCIPVTPGNAADWGERAESFEAIGVGRGWSFRMRQDGESVGVRSGLATPGLFRTLGAHAVRGRLLQRDDMLPEGDARSVVVSHGFWQSQLGADPDVVGSTMILDDDAYTVIGVLAAGVEVPRLDWVDVWAPLHIAPRGEEGRGWHGFRGYGRLADGVSVAEAEAELNRIHADLAEVHPETAEGWSVRVRTMKDVIVGGTRPLLVLFLGAVIVVLLIVSVNLASFLLARATNRARELAVRSALGADRPALVRQLLVEAGLLGLLGGAAGIIAALWATEAFVALAPAGVPRIDEVAVDGRILAFGLAVTLLSAFIFGLAPATRVRTFNLTETLKDARSGTVDRRSSRLRRALVVTELALALALVLSAGLLLRSFGTLVAWDPGFEIEEVLTFQVFPPSSRYPDDEARIAFYRNARERLAAIPGVESVGSASAGPLFGGSDGTVPFQVAGRPAVAIQDAPRARWYDVGAGYFPTLGVPIVEGRNLQETDDLGSTSVVLINEALARRHWPDASPLGARLRAPDLGLEATVVGVVPSFRPFNPEEPPAPALYLSNRQMVRGATHYVLRTDGDPTNVFPAVRRVVAGLDPEVEPVRLATLESSLAGQLVGPRFNLLLVGLFAVVALILGATGVYGVIAYAVALRTREIGIRMALGAARRDVLRSVLGDGLRLVGAGLLVGALVALVFTRLLQGVIVGVEPTDPLAVIGTGLVLGATGLTAALVPAVRAARTDPVEAIRSE